MRIFVVVLVVSFVLGGFIGGELTDRTFLVTGATLGMLLVGGAVFAGGAFFTARDEKRKRAGLTPEIREVFGRMLARGAMSAVQTKDPDPTGSERAAETPEATFFRTVSGLLTLQLAPKYEKPWQAFSALAVHRRAQGYIFGFHDALLQALGLRGDLDKAADLIERSYKSMFGESSGFALYSTSLSSQSNPDFADGRMEGGNELADFLQKNTPPLGLGRMLVLEPELRQASRPCEERSPAKEHNDFSRLIFEIERVFRRVVRPPAPADTVGTVLQRSSIFDAIIPFAYGLTVLRRATVDSGYLPSQGHRILAGMVEERLLKHRIEIAEGMSQTAPKLPGMSVTPDEERIRAQVQKELREALEAIAEGPMLRPLFIAKANLLQQYVTSAPFVDEAQRPALMEAMSRLVDAYVSSELTAF